MTTVYHCANAHWEYPRLTRHQGSIRNNAQPICGATKGYMHIIVPPKEFVKLNRDVDYYILKSYYEGTVHLCQKCFKHEDLPLLLLAGLDE